MEIPLGSVVKEGLVVTEACPVTPGSHSVIWMYCMVVNCPGAVGIGDTVGVSSAATYARHPDAKDGLIGLAHADGLGEEILLRGGLKGTVDCAETAGPAAVI